MGRLKEQDGKVKEGKQHIKRAEALEKELGMQLLPYKIRS